LRNKILTEASSMACSATGSEAAARFMVAGSPDKDCAVSKEGGVKDCLDSGFRSSSSNSTPISEALGRVVGCEAHDRLIRDQTASVNPTAAQVQVSGRSGRSSSRTTSSYKRLSSVAPKGTNPEKICKISVKAYTQVSSATT
jgi:hypothetical protein